MNPPRVTVIAGHFGSGKTEFAINYALRLAAGGSPVRLFDFDFVNPYFRSRRFRAELAGLGVDVVEPANRQIARADIPSIARGLGEALDPPPGAGGVAPRLVVEVGGDPVGARVLAATAAGLAAAGCDFLSVFNPFRPDNDSRDKVIAMTRAIEAVAGLRTTALVANPHLKEETDGPVLRRGLAFAREVEREFLPVRYFCVLEGTPLPAEVADGPYEIFRLRKFNAYCHEA